MSLKKAVLRLEVSWKSQQQSSLPACHLPIVIVGNKFLPPSSIIPCLNIGYIYLELYCFSVGTVLEQMHTKHWAQWDLHCDGDHWMPLRFRSTVTAKKLSFLPHFIFSSIRNKQANQQILNHKSVHKLKT